MRRAILRRVGVVLCAALALLAAVLIRPDPAFAHVREHRAFRVMSDRPIDPAIDRVLDDAMDRIARSTLYRPGERFRVFICNDPWRMALFTRMPSAGGVTDMAVTRNIYLRQSDPARNRVVIPAEWGPLADADVRTLAYFIAHEATHVLQSRRLGRWRSLSAPRWLREGHADCVAKAGRFDRAANRASMRRGEYLLSEAYARHGLYRRYHLMVAAQLDRPGITVERLFADPPSVIEAARAAMTGDPAASRGSPEPDPIRTYL